MNECTYKNYDELPLTLNVVQVAAVLGISRAGAYELVHSEGIYQSVRWRWHSLPSGSGTE